MPFPLCPTLQNTGPRCPLPEQEQGSSARFPGKAMPLFLPLLGNQLELFHVMAFAPAENAWENRQEAHAEMWPAFPTAKPTCHCPWAGQAGCGTRGAEGKREEEQMGRVGCERGWCCTPGGFPAWFRAPEESLEKGHPGNDPAYPTPVPVQGLAPRGAAWLGYGLWGEFCGGCRRDPPLSPGRRRARLMLAQLDCRWDRAVLSSGHYIPLGHL